MAAENKIGNARIMSKIIINSSFKLIILLLSIDVCYNIETGMRQCASPDCKSELFEVIL